MENDIDLRNVCQLVMWEGMLGFPISVLIHSVYMMGFSLLCVLFSGLIFYHTGGIVNQIRVICPGCNALELRSRRMDEPIGGVVEERCLFCDDGLVEGEG